jgi:hypothetical protein
MIEMKDEMKTLLMLFPLVTIAAFGVNGCAGSNATPGIPQATTATPQTAESWIDAKAPATLLYVSDAGTGTVGVYAFPKGRQVGTLKGFSQPMGECVDLSGNIYVTDQTAMKIYEFAHGKSKPIQTMDTSPYAPYGCAANLHGGAQTGYFAHINMPDAKDPAGSVTILGAGHGAGQLSMRQFSSLGFICYDQHPESAILWADGLDANGAFQMADFAPHRKKFDVVHFPNVLQAPGDVWWDGRHLDVADEAGPSGTTAISQYVDAGHQISLVGTVSLSLQATQFVTGASLLVATVASKHEVAFWSYPAGGKPTKTITGFSNPFGIAISPVLPK